MTDIIEQPVTVRGTTRDKAPEPTLSDTAIRGDRYWSPEFARREEEALWPRVWQVAGRVDQIPEPGDYVTYEIGRDSIIAVRGMDGVVRAFYNVCQHRGNRLVTAEVGSLLAGEFQCAYHGWRFGTDGRLSERAGPFRHLPRINVQVRTVDPGRSLLEHEATVFDDETLTGRRVRPTV